jgi:hypothetical protein
MTDSRLTEPAATFEDGDAPAPDWTLSAERVPVFVAVHRFDEDGYALPEPERIEITMPRRPNPRLGLEFLRRARSEGELATAWLIEEAIGGDGFDTLLAELDRMPNPEDGQAALIAISERIQRVVMGGLEGPKASRNGRG